MTWVMNAKGRYERPCTKCGGTGKQEMFYADWAACQCSEHWDQVEHPANARDSHVTKALMRCDVCGLVWWLITDHSDDSIDVPAPEIIGRRIPEDDWRHPAEQKA